MSSWFEFVGKYVSKPLSSLLFVIYRTFRMKYRQAFSSRYTLDERCVFSLLRCRVIRVTDKEKHDRGSVRALCFGGIVRYNPLWLDGTDCFPELRLKTVIHFDPLAGDEPREDASKRAC